MIGMILRVVRKIEVSRLGLQFLNRKDLYFIYNIRTNYVIPNIDAGDLECIIVNMIPFLEWFPYEFYIDHYNKDIKIVYKNHSVLIDKYVYILYLPKKE